MVFILSHCVKELLQFSRYFSQSFSNASCRFGGSNPRPCEENTTQIAANASNTPRIPLQAQKQTKVNKKSLLTYRHSLNPNLFNFQHIAACGHRWDDHGGFQTLKGQQSGPSCGTMLRLTSFVRSMGMPYFSPEVFAFEIELIVPLNHLGYLRCCCNLPKNMQ